MTATTPIAATDTVLEQARRVARTLPARAAEIEAARRLPADLLDDLVAAGCFRILLPRSHGGFEASLPESFELFETLARGDASTGWTVAIGASGWCDLAELPRPTFDALFPPATDVIVAGAFAPSGSITPTVGGYRLSGRWGFASGCEHATLFFVNAMEGFADGAPLMRVSALAPADVAIEDTWRVAGLRGTGSHHLRVDDVTVPPERTFVPLTDPPCLDAPVTRVPTPAVFALGIASVAVGTARGALDELADLAQGKVPLLSAGTLATNPLFHHDLAQAEAGLAAARSLLMDTARGLWALAEAGEVPSLDDRARARAAATWVTDAALAATTFAYRAGGGTAVYDDSPLQRRLRDVHAMTQHFLVRPDSLVAAGAVLSGQELPTPVF